METSGEMFIGHLYGFLLMDHVDEDDDSLHFHKMWV